MRKIRDLKGLGPASETLLASIQVVSVDDFLSRDPFILFQQLKQKHDVSLIMLYAMIGARENRAWQEVKQTDKSQILLRLDEMGLAPK